MGGIHAEEVNRLRERLSGSYHRTTRLNPGKSEAALLTPRRFSRGMGPYGVEWETTNLNKAAEREVVRQIETVFKRRKVF